MKTWSSQCSLASLKFTWTTMWSPGWLHVSWQQGQSLNTQRNHMNQWRISRVQIMSLLPPIKPSSSSGTQRVMWEAAHCRLVGSSDAEMHDRRLPSDFTTRLYEHIKFQIFKAAVRNFYVSIDISLKPLQEEVIQRRLSRSAPLTPRGIFQYLFFLDLVSWGNIPALAHRKWRILPGFTWLWEGRGEDSAARSNMA